MHEGYNKVNREMPPTIHPVEHLVFGRLYNQFKLLQCLVVNFYLRTSSYNSIERNPMTLSIKGNEFYKLEIFWIASYVLSCINEINSKEHICSNPFPVKSLLGLISTLINSGRFKYRHRNILGTVCNEVYWSVLFIRVSLHWDIVTISFLKPHFKKHLS